MARFASIAFHFVVILLILLAPKIFPYHPPTDAEIARNITDLYIPSDLNRFSRTPSAPQPKTPVMKVDPRLLRQLAPPARRAARPPCSARTAARGSGSRRSPRRLLRCPRRTRRRAPSGRKRLRPIRSQPGAAAVFAGQGVAGIHARGHEGRRVGERHLGSVAALPGAAAVERRWWRRARVWRQCGGNPHAHRGSRLFTAYIARVLASVKRTGMP